LGKTLGTGGEQCSQQYDTAMHEVADCSILSKWFLWQPAMPPSRTAVQKHTSAQVQLVSGGKHATQFVRCHTRQPAAVLHPGNLKVDGAICFRWIVCLRYIAGFAIVKLATDKKSGEQYAVKIMTLPPAGMEPGDNENTR